MEKKLTGQIVDTEHYKYDRVKVRGPDGVARYTAGNKDAIAKSLFGMTRQQMQSIAKANNLDLNSHAKLRNLGHYRMILGQSLRAIVGRGKSVNVLGRWITSLDQKVNWPKGFKEEPKGTHAKPIRKKS